MRQKLIITGLTLLYIGCTPCPVIKKQVPVYNKHTGKNLGVDTVSYVIGFPDAFARTRFTQTFEEFLAKYPFNRIKHATQKDFFKLTMLPVIPKTEAAELPKEEPAKKDDFIETLLSLQITDSGIMQQVVPGANAVIYAPRGGEDITYQRLTGGVSLLCNGDAGACADTCLLRLKDSLPQRLTLQVQPCIQAKSGIPVSAFDIVDSWTTFVRQYPARGRACFRAVAGIDAFLGGSETVIDGFKIIDDKTITLVLNHADPQALARLCLPQMLSPALGLGRYYAGAQSASEIVLSPNSHFPCEKPLLGKCVIKSAIDNNPFVAFSLNKYDILMLSGNVDIDYARRNQAAAGDLIVFGSDRYFVSCALEPEAARRNLVNRIRVKDILTIVKVDGRRIGMIETESTLPDTISRSKTLVNRPDVFKQPCVIIYRVQDAISRKVAEKIVADLSSQGLSCAIKPLTNPDWEHALLKRDYALAVGWISSDIVTSPGLRAVLASLWFNDLSEEPLRIAGGYELPLFSVNNYLFCKKRVGFFKDALEGIYIKK